MTLLGPEIQILRTVQVRVGVSDVIKEVDLVFWKEEGDGHHMYRCITLSLSKGEKRMGGISWELHRRRLD